jgi:hypothetical protein
LAYELQKAEHGILTVLRGTADSGIFDSGKRVELV